jgi:uncharacterized protein
MNSYNVTAPAIPREAVVASFFGRVYMWMTIGLGLTAGVGYLIASNPALQAVVLGNPFVFWPALFAPLAIVLVMGTAAERLGPAGAAAFFLLFSIVEGLTFSVIFLAYTSASIASVFVVTAGTFAAAGFVGFVIKRDLSAMGQFFVMGVIGLVIASVVNIFLQSDALTWVLSVLGVVIFSGLTAWDHQKLRQLALAGGGTATAAIFGALSLQLDFINLFLSLLRLFGVHRDE